jgi:NitT/TauT family transport system ATP-binding protein
LSSPNPSLSVRISGLTKVYPSRAGRAPFTALKDVALDVRAGEILSLIGPSGCGKTTLLKVIDGLVPAEHGSVQVFPQGSADRAFSRDRAFVFQDFGLFPWRTVLANVAFPLELLHVPKKERETRAMRLLELVNLGPFAKRHPFELSGGMQQRVGLARALAVDPDVLLMDEPLGALDEQTRENMQLEILDICATTGKTVIFVTHSVDEAIFISDRIAVMSSSPGQIREILTVDLPRPRTRDGTRADARFGELRAQVWRLIGVSSEGRT